MATKKLTQIKPQNTIIPIPEVPAPVLPGVPAITPGTETLKPVVPLPPKGSGSTSSKSSNSSKKREQQRLLQEIKKDYDQQWELEVPLVKDTKRLLSRLKTEGRNLGKEALYLPTNTIHFFGGLAVDAQRMTDPRILISSGYRDYLFNEYIPNSTAQAAGVSAKDTLQFWDVIPEYIDTWQSGQPISSLVLRDAGNLSLIFGGLRAGFKATGAKAAARGAAAEAAVQAGGLADEAAAAAGTAYAKRMNRVSDQMYKMADYSNRVVHYTNEVGMVPFKPWIYGGSKLGAASRNGVYVEGLVGWGARAAEGYKKEIEALREAEPDIQFNDPRLKDLRDKVARNIRRSLTHATKAKIRQATRNMQHESDLMQKTLTNIEKNPLYADEINEATGEKWGELSPAENEAVIAVLNGRANLVAWLVENLGMTPERVSVLGRYDATPEYYLSEAGARLAYDMIRGDMDNIQYERLADAVQRLGQVLRDTTQRAVEGYGRRSALSPDYLKPIPFWNKLRAAVAASGNKELMKMVDSIDEIQQQIDAGEIEMTPAEFETFKKMRDELSITIIEQLPDELALDPGLYPASMRENVEFFRRVRRSLNQGEVARAEGDPLPPRDGGPRAPESPWDPFDREPVERPEGFAMPRRRGKINAAEGMLGRVRKNLKDLRAAIINITDKMAQLEEKHVVLAEKLRKYDVVEAYIAGKDVKWIAKKFRLSVGDVQQILKSSPLRRQFDTMEALRLEIEELQKVIGVKRTRLRGPEAEAELVALQEQLAEVRRQADVASQALQAARNVNEIARQADESAVDKLVEEQDKLEDDLYDAETRFENEGGDTESLHEAIDPTDTDLLPVTVDNAFQMVLSITLLLDEIVPVLEESGAAQLGEAMQRIAKTLELAMNDAEQLYTSAESPARRRVGELRIQQLGNLLTTITTRLNAILSDPPEGVLAEQAIVNEMSSIVSNPETQAIIAGTAPLSSRVGGKNRGTAGRFEVMEAAGYLDPETGEITSPRDLGMDNQSLYNNKNPRSKNYIPYLDAVIEEFSNPQNFLDIDAVVYDGNTAKLVKTAEILARWIRDVRNAGSQKAQIEMILNPPDYVPPALAKKLLQGMTRDPYAVAKKAVDDVTHPMDKFVRKVVRKLDEVIGEINRINDHYRIFGELSYIEWEKFPGVKLQKDWSGSGELTEIKINFGPKAEGVVPEIAFNISTPVESVLQAVDALIEAIEQDKGAQVRLYQLVEETSFAVQITGLTKGKAASKAQVLKDLQKFKQDILKAKKITPKNRASKVVRENLLPDVVPDEVTAAPAKLTSVETAPKPGQNTRADYVIIPCGNAKLGKAAPAAEFYTGSMFKDALATARQMFSDDRIFVISAEHGLMRLDEVVEPYDKKMGDPGSVEPFEVARQLENLEGGKILSLLPKDYHAVLKEATNPTYWDGPSSPFEVEQAYEGTRGIGEQKGRLKQLRQENQPVIAEDAPGAAPLPDDLEQMVVRALDDEAYWEELVDKEQSVIAYEKDMDRALNPTPEDIAEFKAQTLKALEDEITSFNGFAESNLGALWLRENNTARFWLTPVKGMPEWEWWYQLPAKQRQKIARDFFYSEKRLAPAKKGSTRSAWRTERKTQGIDEIADEAGMTVDEWADAFLDYVNRIQNARRRAKESNEMPLDEYATEYSRVNTEEMMRYKDEVGDMTAAEYDQIFKRIDYLKAEETGKAPENLRPIANAPDEVRPDPTIADPTVREAAYAVDVVDAMAKDAANKMRRAERLSEKTKAFEEFIATAKKYDEATKRFEKTRLGRVKVEQAMARNEAERRKLRRRREEARKLERKLKKVERDLNTSSGVEQIRLMRGSVPLQIAVEGEYPSAQFGVDIPLEDGGVNTIPLEGPMYVPTGRPRGFTGSLSMEQLKRGLEGFNTLTSEHYRDGDRHTIFSIRQLALRMGRESATMTGNEAYKAIVAQFGEEAVAVLTEDLSLSLYEKAYERVSSMPLAEQIRLGYRGVVEEQQAAINPEGAVFDEATAGAIDRLVDDGVASYSQGVPDPAAAFNAALKEEFGRLVAEEMALRGYVAVDPFARIGAALPYGKVTHKTMFLPVGLREYISSIEVVSDPNTWSQVQKAAFKVTGAMKTTTLVFSVAWQLGDLISNVMLAAMSGQDVSVADMVRRMKDVKQKEYGPGLRSIWDPRAEAPTPTRDVRLAQEAPIQDIGASQAERRYIYNIPEVAEKAPLLKRVTGFDYPEPLQGRGVTKVAFRINEAINRLSRHAFFLELLDNELAKRNLTIDDIADTWRSDPTLRKLVFDVADTANDFLGDFADLSLAERKLVALGVPFYSWAKHIHRVTMLIGRENPSALRWYFYLGALNYDPNEDPFNLRYGALNLFGGSVSTNILNPFGDVFSGPIADLVIDQDPRTALGTLGPVPRLVSAGLFGTDITKLQPISRPTATSRYNEAGQLIPTPLLTSPTEMAGYTAQQFPIVQRFLNTLPEGTIPGTRIATGPVSRYGTGEARLRKGTNKTIRRPGGQLAAIGRIFSLPGIPYQSEDQLMDIEQAAKARLRTINSMRRLRAAKLDQQFTPVGPR